MIHLGLIKDNSPIHTVQEVFHFIQTSAKAKSKKRKFREVIRHIVILNFLKKIYATTVSPCWQTVYIYIITPSSTGTFLYPIRIQHRAERAL